jgi:hypothetical protein
MGDVTLNKVAKGDTASTSITGLTDSAISDDGCGVGIASGAPNGLLQLASSYVVAHAPSDDHSGVTDLANIKAAITAVTRFGTGGGTVYLQAGDYYINEVILLVCLDNNGINIIGAGTECTRIYMNDDSNPRVVFELSNSIIHFSIQNLSICSEQSNKSHIGIKFSDGWFGDVKNVRIVGMDIGILLDNGANNAFRNVYVTNCNTGIQFGATDGVIANANWIYGGKVWGCTDYGVRFLLGEGNSIFGLDIVGNGTVEGNAGVSFEYDGGNYISGCYFEHNYSSLVKVASKNNSIMNCICGKGKAFEFIHWESGFEGVANGNVVLGNRLWGLIGEERKESIGSILGIGTPDPGAKLTVKSDVETPENGAIITSGSSTTVKTYEFDRADSALHKILTDDGGGTTVRALKITGEDVVKTGAVPSTTVQVIDNDDFDRLRVGARITASTTPDPTVRYVTEKSTTSNEITVNEEVDWYNSGSGYSFEYENPAFLNIHAAMRLTSGPTFQSKTVIINKTDDYSVTVETAVDWYNSGSGYTFKYEYPSFMNFAPGVQLFAHSEMRTITEVFDNDPFTVTVDSSWDLSGNLFAYKWPLLDLRDNASSKVFVDPDGKTGVGTTSPSALLTVSGGSPDTTNGIGQFVNSSMAEDEFNFLLVGKSASDGEGARFGYRYLPSYNSEFAFMGVKGDSFDNSFLVRKGGNVGIGWGWPMSKLAVTGGVTIGSDWGQYTAPEYGMIVEGKVGIGTTDPKGTLQLSDKGSLDVTYPGEIALRYNHYYDSGNKWLTGSGKACAIISCNDGIKMIGSNDDSTGAGDSVTNLNDLVIVKLDGNMGVGTTGPATKLELAETKTITGATSDGYSAGLTLDPFYYAASAQTVTRHNYIDVNNPNTNNVAITNAAVMRFDDVPGTHKALDTGYPGTTKASPGNVDAWIKVNINGTIYYVPAYASKTA